MLVGLWDLATGLYMLLAPEPWRAHGPETLWMTAGPALRDHGAVGVAAMSMLRRIGAFSFYAGALSVGLAWHARRAPHTLTALLAIYTSVGIAFNLTDRAYFAGTSYFVAKQAIGAVWTVGLALHAWERWRARAAGVQPM